MPRPLLMWVIQNHRRMQRHWIPHHWRHKLTKAPCDWLWPTSFYAGPESVPTFNISCFPTQVLGPISTTQTSYRHQHRSREGANWEKLGQWQTRRTRYWPCISFWERNEKCRGQKRGHIMRWTIWISTYFDVEWCWPCWPFEGTRHWSSEGSSGSWIKFGKLFLFILVLGPNLLNNYRRTTSGCLLHIASQWRTR